MKSLVPTPGPTYTPDEGATTRAAAAVQGMEMLQDRSKMTGYGAEKYRLVNQRDEVVSVLQNGLVVIAKRVASPVVSVRAYVYTGGVYEGRWLGGGLSHLLEHLVAGGSTENHSEAENRNLLQALGNNSNAYTTTDHTAYFINTTNDRMEQAVELVGRWMLSAKITPDEYRREYQVVQRELEMGKGEPDRVHYYMTQANRYQVSPARVPTIGYQEVIQGLKRDDVYEYYKLTYQPNNMVFCVAGDLPPAKMLAAVQKQVAGAKPGRVFSRDIPKEPPVTAPRTMVGTFPKLGQARLELGFPTVELTHPDLYALDLLATVLGSGESAMLVEVMRDELQLVSSINASSYTPTYADGTFQVEMQLAPDKLHDATEVALSLIEAAKKEGGIPVERIARAKTQMKANRVKQLQTSEEVGGSLATDFMSTGDPHFSDRYVERIQEVTPEQLRQVASKYLDRGRLLTTALLPAEFVGAEGLPKAEDLLRPVAPTTQPGQAIPDSQIAKVELDNGTVLLTKRITTSPLVVMNMYAVGGLTAEDQKTNGLGNLSMKMLARGTKTRSAQYIAEFWDSIGGDFDASCGSNSWVWKATCLKADFDKAFEVYADTVNNPAFADAELGKVKPRVLAEIAQQDSDWLPQSVRFFRKQFYGPMNSPYQFMAVGTESNVQGFGVRQVRDWYEQKVKPARRVIAIFGDVDVKQAEKLARQHFGQANGQGQGNPDDRQPAAAARKPSPNTGKPAVNVERVEVNKTEQALAGVVIGFKANSVIGEPATFPIAVGDTMASGYNYGAGYLYEILRGRGLVYVVHAVNSPGRSPRLPGSFFVYAGCEPSKVNEVIDVIVENVARLQGTPKDANEDWFRRSKDLVVVAEAMETETPSAQAEQAALDELYGLGYNWHQQFADKIRAVQFPEVQRAARERLTECVVTVSTPQPEQVKVKPGRRQFDSFAPVDLTPRGVQHDTGGK
jgi:zinc protease